MTTETTNSEIYSATLHFHYTLNLECPYCDAQIDFSGLSDHEATISNLIFNNKWESIAGMEMECDSCLKEFTIEKMEY